MPTVARPLPEKIDLVLAAFPPAPPLGGPETATVRGWETGNWIMRWWIMKSSKRYTFIPDPISRSAKAFQCSKCHAFCMRGLDHDRLAGIAIVDSRPLNVQGELIALLEGRATYDLAWRGYRYEIDFRELETVKASPPGMKADVDVVCAHVCGRPVICIMPLRRGGPRTGPAADLNSECPF